MRNANIATLNPGLENRERDEIKTPSIKHEWFTTRGKTMMEWERVTDTGTDRLKVDGGHIYRDQKGNGGLAMCFVPGIDLARYESHLRDAYNQGMKDGLAFSDEDRDEQNNG